MLDYIRIACAVPAVKVGDVIKNTQDICLWMEKADTQGADIVVFPELAMTGYTCGDLFFQDTLHKAVKRGLQEVLACSGDHPGLTAVVGLPLRIGAGLYNCAAVISDGRLCGVVPKTFIPNHDFPEKRWFASGMDMAICLEPKDFDIDCGDDWYSVDVSSKLLFQVGDAKVGIEICQDLMVPQPPSVQLALDGAEIILNLSASNEQVGKRLRRRELVNHQSASLNCVYVFCSAGCTESTQDMVFSGHSLIAENGTVLTENKDQIASDYMLIMDCDLGKIRGDRLKNPCFGQPEDACTISAVHDMTLRGDGSLYPLRKLPFIPDNKEDRYARCLEIFAIQVAGLKRRLATINANPVIGISGGLDSTLALLVSVEAMRQLGKPVSQVYGVTMPCFGTSDRTYNNAWEMMRKLGISCKEINIRDAVSQHFADIGHDPAVHNATYENSQARERTQILMDYASVVGGIVVGTGDLSELALGWCTYNGDHMSMYSVNAAVPKTLIRWIIEAVSEQESFAPAKAVLMDVLDTPISPELLPPDAQGKISQQTEDIVGPYALHDFFLYYVLRYGFTPEKIYALACRAFEKEFDKAVVKKWLVNFYRRFFTQQFKRNCVPDGVGIGSVGFSPRTSWHMPSDAAARIWLEEAEKL